MARTLEVSRSRLNRLLMAALAVGWVAGTCTGVAIAEERTCGAGPVWVEFREFVPCLDKLPECTVPTADGHYEIAPHGCVVTGWPCLEQIRWLEKWSDWPHCEGRRLWRPRER